MLPENALEQYKYNTHDPLITGHIGGSLQMCVAQLYAKFLSTEQKKMTPICQVKVLLLLLHKLLFACASVLWERARERVHEDINEKRGFLELG